MMFWFSFFGAMVGVWVGVVAAWHWFEREMKKNPEAFRRGWEGATKPVGLGVLSQPGPRYARKPIFECCNCGVSHYQMGSTWIDDNGGQWCAPCYAQEKADESLAADKQTVDGFWCGDCKNWFPPVPFEGQVYHNASGEQVCDSCDQVQARVSKAREGAFFCCRCKEMSSLEVVTRTASGEPLCRVCATVLRSEQS